VSAAPVAEHLVRCPYCGQAAMKLWRKCILGPETAVPCANCGRRVSVPWGAIAAATPIALGIVAAVRLPAPWSVAGLVGGLAAMLQFSGISFP
jgi:DNA-directed RNA polymerase subunit RPC12/RpoP